MFGSLEVMSTESTNIRFIMKCDNNYNSRRCCHFYSSITHYLYLQGGAASLFNFCYNLVKNVKNFKKMLVGGAAINTKWTKCHIILLPAKSTIT